MFGGSGNKKSSKTRYDRIGDDVVEDQQGVVEQIQDETNDHREEVEQDVKEVVEADSAEKATEEIPTIPKNKFVAKGDADVSVDIERGENKDESTAEEEKIKAEKLAEEVENDPNAMTLNVKATDEKTHKVRISGRASVTDLKAKIASITEFGPERQRLIFLGKMLDDAMNLCDYNIKDGNFIHLVPKPAGFVAPPSDDNSGSNGNNNRSEETINLHDIQIGLFQDTGRGYQPQGAFERDYIQTLTLGLWRARIRLMSSLMLFYYFLEFMTNLSFWLHPDQANFQFEEGHHPSDLFFAIDALENVAGMITAWWGLKTAADDSTFLSKRFFLAMCRLCIVHFASLTIYSHELLSGQVVLKTMRHYTSRDPSELGVSVIFNVMINIMIWATCIGVASRYHGELLAIEEQRDPSQQRRDSENDEETTMENPTVVVVQQ